MEANVVQIIEGLINKTTAKKANWKESSTKGEYKILFDGATLTIGGFVNSYGNYYVLTIFNKEGRVIVRESFYDNDPSCKLLRDLYASAQESSLKKNDTLESILDQLKKETVGEDDMSELPF